MSCMASTALDSGRQVLGLLREAADAGHTVVLVTHSPLAVRRLCNRAVWIDQGQVIAVVTQAKVGMEIAQGVDKVRRLRVAGRDERHQCRSPFFRCGPDRRASGW